MCGLNGAFGKIDHKEKAVLNLLSMFSQLRGRHSTGVGLVYKNRQRKPVVAKAVGGQESLVLEHKAHFDQKNWSLSAHDLRCALGHNRYATVGLINEENAHPFLMGDVVGTHNGTVSDYSLKGLDAYDYTKTDSQIIIGELGKGTHVKEVIKYAQGAWALVWYNHKTHTLHMCRNKERTLYICMSKDTKTVFWASEAWMIRQALGYVGLTKDYDEVKSVIEDRHLTWSTEKHNDIKLKIGEAVGGKIKPFTRVAPVADTGWPQRIMDTVGKVVSITKNKEITEAAVVEEEGYTEDYTKGYDNKLIHRNKFEKLIEEGCAWCTGALFWEGRENIEWFDKSSPICIDCSQHLKDTHGYNLERVH